MVLAAAAVPGPAATETDERIIAAVQGSYNFRTYLKDDKVAVASRNGAVTLTGTVQDAFRRALAEETVAGDHPRRRDIRRKIDDASITAQVKMALLFNRATSALKTKVRTDNGVVTLTGAAKSKAEKDLVTRIARNIQGIRMVRNRMTVEG